MSDDREEANCAWAIPQDCRERRLVTGAGGALERKDPYTHETPLIAQVQLGEFENAKRLLQAGADANAATAGGERALLIAAKMGARTWWSCLRAASSAH